MLVGMSAGFLNFTSTALGRPESILLDRELARFIYVREVKRFDPFKLCIYAWCIKIAIAGSLAPVRLTWMPFLRVQKNAFIYVEADTKKLYAGM